MLTGKKNAIPALPETQVCFKALVSFTVYKNTGSSDTQFCLEQQWFVSKTKTDS